MIALVIAGRHQPIHLLEFRPHGAVRPTGAHEVDRAAAPELYDLVAHLARAPACRCRACFLMDERSPWFATGRNPENAAVAVTTGLVQQLSRDFRRDRARARAHQKSRHPLMTITATIAARSRWSRSSGMSSAATATTQRPRHVGSILMIPGAARRDAGADGDQPHPRIPAPTISARASPAQPMWLASALMKIGTAGASGAEPEAERNPRPRTCSSSTRCPARRRQSLYHASVHGRPYRGVAAARGGIGRAGRAPRGSGAHYPSRRPWGGGSHGTGLGGNNVRRPGQVRRSERDPGPINYRC